jgi:hypothetical protein
MDLLYRVEVGWAGGVFGGLKPDLDSSHIPLEDSQVSVGLRVGGTASNGCHQHLVPIMRFALERSMPFI